MKRFFLLLTTLALLITSCAKDDTTTIIEGEETLVSFKVMSPKIQTRYGEGLTANKLFYAVYQNGALMDKISVLTADKAIDINNLTADVKIALVSGLTYDILFWAQAADAPYSFDGAKVSIDYAGLTANEESYDAFFRNYRVEINGTKPHRVELYRPFAQLNIATGDLEKAKRAGFDLESTSITVETCTVLDLASGVASEPQRMTFALNDKTEGKYEGYDIISMNYLLVNQEKEVIDVRFNAQGGNDLIERNYFNIPFQRNHQTFMVGDILTKSSLFHVYINPIFGDDIIYTPPVEYYLYYTSTDGQIVEPYNELAFGANITGNTYKNGKGKITFDGPITEIGERAFAYCNNLSGITIPKSVTNIGYNAFYASGISSITIPDNVATVERGAFINCGNLNAFYGKYASDDNLSLIVDGVLIAAAPAGLSTTYTIPDGVTIIGEGAFYICYSLTSLTIPDSIENIEINAFSFCYLDAFYCKYASDDKRCIIIDGRLVAFASHNLNSYTIPEGVTTIEDCVFFDRASIAITLPESLIEIGYYAFGSCEFMYDITIPKNVTRIGNNAFLYCRDLNTIYCKPTTPPELGYSVFGYEYRPEIKIYVPAEAVDAYKQAEYWSEYADNIFAE